MEDSEKEVCEEKSINFEINHFNVAQSSLSDTIHRNVEVVEQSGNGIYNYYPST